MKYAKPNACLQEVSDKTHMDGGTISNSLSGRFIKQLPDNQISISTQYEYGYDSKQPVRRH